MKKYTYSTLTAMLVLVTAFLHPLFAQKTTYQLQKEFVDMRFGMFVHFNLGTFTNEEWAEPNQDPMKFAPTNVDCAQWATVAKSAGMKFGILTTKHHDGFSLWPTKYGKKNTFGTYQNVMYSGWKKDIVRSFVDEFRKAGLTPCMYYSIWDRTQDIQGGTLSQANKDVIKGQLTELLGGTYGQFPLIIFDGWSWMMGHNAVAYQFIRETVKSLQPNCMIADHNGLIQPYEEDILNFEWFTAPTGNTYASTRGVSITPSGWFWHPNTPTRDPMSLNNIVNGSGLATTEPRYCNMLLNCPPNRNGQIDANVVQRLKEVGAAWKPNLNRAPLPAQPEQCEHPITPVAAFASSNSSTAWNAVDGVMNYERGDNVRQSMWQSSGSLPQSVTIDLGKNYSNIDMATYTPRQDHQTKNTGNNPNNFVTTGNILGYNIYVSTDNRTYTKVASGTWAANALVKRVKFTPTNARYVRVEATSANEGSVAIVSEFGAGGHAKKPEPDGTTNPPTSGVIDNGTYTITVQHSGQNMDVAARSAVDGGDVIQYTASGATNQQWVVTAVADGYYTLRAVHSGKYLHVYEASTADGGDVVQWSGGTATNQQFQITALANGYYQIVARHSGKCVNVANASTTPGANIQQWTCSGAANQQFRFTPVSTARIASQATEEGALLAYPNPSSDAFLLKVPGDFFYVIKDSEGKVKEKGTGTGETAIGKTLKPGMYFLQIQHSGETKQVKLIKN